MKSLKLSILLIIGLIFLNQTGFAQTIDERIKRATDAINKNDLDGAMPDLEEVLKAQSNNADALNLRGIINFRRKNYDQANTDFNQAIASNPRFSAAYFNRGLIFENKSDYESAVSDFSRSIEFAPTYAAAYNERGFAFMKLSNWVAAESDFTFAIKYGISDKFIYLNRGATRYNSGNYDQAVADYRKSLEFDPNYELAQTHLTEGLKMQQKIAAQSPAPQLTASIPDGSLEKPNESLNRAVTLINAGNFNESLRILNDACKAEPQNPVPFYLIGILYYKQRDFEKAHTSETEAIKLNPNIAEFYYVRGISRAYNPNIWSIAEQNEGYDDFIKAIQIKKTAEAYHEKAVYEYNVLGDHILACSTAEDAVQFNPKDGESYYICGMRYRWGVKYKEAVESFTQAINAGFDRSEVYRYRGDLLSRLNKRKEAAADQTKADELDAVNPPLPQKNNQWAVKMRELFKLYNDSAGSAGYWANSAPKANQQEICRALSGWWSATHNANNYLTQLWALSRSEDEKKVFLERSSEADGIEQKALAQIKSNNCSF